MPTTKPRIAWIDLLETIAITMVVLYHCTAYIAGLEWPSDNFSFSLFYFSRSILSVCVPIFFFVNGYLLFHQKFDFRKHLSKIFKFIFIALFWYAATLLIMTAFHPEQVSSNGFLSTLLSLKSGINHLWYLGALVCLYLIFPLLKVVYDHSPKVFTYFTIICLLLTFGNSILNELLTFIAWLLGREAIFTETNFFSIFNPLRGLYAFSFAYFCLGGIVYRYRERIRTWFSQVRARNLIAVICLGLGWLGIFGYGVFYSQLTHQIWDNVWHGYSSIWTLLGVIGIFLLSLNWHRDSRVVSTISRHTLGIYLIHMVIIYILNIFFGEFITGVLNPTTAGSALVTLFLYIIYDIIVLTISLFSTIILRKIPLLRAVVN